ncbi:MAG: 1-acyl-sn-glycerol-3-phosphate acyltransferase [Crocinitomicaceae bacterium]|nr:1-acyl-sn-glycerol-3-phosphate acyltransferase [Crocinitomicaceae bacterium]MDG2463837.1 1-acyl-sn-glycerol-3-phosphate acyltransferase [Crocinitomicaceae bacterium]
MRFLYFILFFVLKYSFWVYFRKVRTHNSPKEFFGRTIYVSNHCASFMDPLIVAAIQRPIVFFMTRSDVFTTLVKPILWASHMLPIFREHDGLDTRTKNEQVFDTCAKILNYNRNLLVFGEGFTDDIFIRRLKPLKKGAVRIGFHALEKYNWKKKIYIAGVGVNYTEPSLMRSDCLVSSSDKICLNDYRAEYEANPNKVITDLTKDIEKRIQEQITHVQIAADAPFHEMVQQITRQGMHPTSGDRSVPLKNRWRNSQKLAHYFNANPDKISGEFANLRERLTNYNAKLKAKKIEDRDLIEFQLKGKFSRLNELLKMILLSPLAVLGLIHCWPIYKIVKNFVEKSFKREVFYGSVKLLLGTIGMGLINIPFIFLFYSFVYPSWWLAILYYSLIGVFFLAMLLFNGALITWKRKGEIKLKYLKDLSTERTALRKEIEGSELNVLN